MSVLIFYKEMHISVQDVYGQAAAQGRCLYFPAGSVHSSYHTSQHWKKRRNNTKDQLIQTENVVTLNIFSKICVVYECSPSRSVFLRSIFKLCSAGVKLKLRSKSRGRLRVKAWFGPRPLCPFSLMSWNITLIRVYMWHPHNAGCELWILSCSTGVGSAFTSWSKPQEPQMEEMCTLVFTTSQRPVFFQSSGSLTCLCCLLTGCLFPITTKITTMFMTHRRCSRQINS